MPDEPLDVLDPDVDARPVLALDPSSNIAIKRDVRRFDVSAPAARMAEAFHTVLRRPGARFGLIEVIRAEGRSGSPYEVGERFQGRFDLERALLDELRDSILRSVSPTVARIVDVLDIDEVLEALADRVASDYGVITELSLEPAPGMPIRMTYEYLEGTPIAGSSIFQVEPLADGGCSCRQIFEYQEQDAGVVLFMGTLGIQMHNDVVRSEIEQAAQLLGARVVRSDIRGDDVAV